MMPYADPEAQRAFNRRWVANRRRAWLARQVCRRCKEHKPDLQIFGKRGRRVSFSRRDIEAQVHTVLCTFCLRKGQAEVRAAREAEAKRAKARRREARVRRAPKPKPPTPRRVAATPPRPAPNVPIEDQRDAEVARQRLTELKDGPSRIISGDELTARLDAMVERPKPAVRKKATPALPAHPYRCPVHGPRSSSVVSYTTDPWGRTVETRRMNCCGRPATEPAPDE